MQQIVGAVTALLDKAEAFCTASGTPPQTLLAARLAEDMSPLTYQVKSVAVHSIGAIEGVRAGSFSPSMSPPPATFAALRERLAATAAGLDAVDPAEVDGFAGRDMRFVMGSFVVEFTAEDFLLSFSQPNFYFHATTAYAILRANGVGVGKIDFLGRYRRKV